MNQYITMPSLGADMTEGKLVRWNIKVGDHVTKGQIVAEIETKKASFEMESFKEGFVSSLDVQPSQIISVGEKMATLNEIEDPLQVLPTPLLHSTVAEEVTSLVDFRGAIAKAMGRSKREIPHYYLKTTVKFDGLIDFMDRYNLDRSADDRLLLPSVFAKIVCLALIEHPEMNGYYQNDQFEVQHEINLGFVVSVRNKGLFVPCLLGAHSKSLSVFDFEFKDLINRTRKGKLRTREISDATFTITNLGDLGVEEVFGVIYPPQVALLGLGKIDKAPVLKQEKWQTGMVATLTLSADHRVTDGLSGSRFLQTIKKKVEEVIVDETF